MNKKVVQTLFYVVLRRTNGSALSTLLISATLPFLISQSFGSSILPFFSCYQCLIFFNFLIYHCPLPSTLTFTLLSNFSHSSTLSILPFSPPYSFFSFTPCLKFTTTLNFPLNSPFILPFTPPHSPGPLTLFYSQLTTLHSFLTLHLLFHSPVLH